LGLGETLGKGIGLDGLHGNEYAPNSWPPHEAILRETLKIGIKGRFEALDYFLGDLPISLGTECAEYWEWDAVHPAFFLSLKNKIKLAHKMPGRMRGIGCIPLLLPLCWFCAQRIAKEYIQMKN